MNGDIGVFWLVVVVVGGSVLAVIALTATAGRIGRRPRLPLGCPPGAPLPLPECVNLYETNAFQLLGLLAHQCSTPAILTRRDEIETILEAEMDVQADIPGYFRVAWPWVADSRRTQPPAEALRAAAGKLEREPDRIAEEVLWFHFDAEHESTLALIGEGKLEEACVLWDNQRNGASSAPGAQALHNLAVARHARALAAERVAAAGTADVSGEGRWASVLRLWARVYENDRCWQYFERRLQSLSDPRVDRQFLHALREDLPRRVLAINATLAAHGDRHAREDYAAFHLGLVALSEFPQEKKDAALAAFFEPVVGEVRALLEPLVQPGAALLNGNAYGALQEQVAAARARLKKYDGERFLAPVAQDVCGPLKRRIESEFNRVAGEFFDLDREVFGTNNKIVGVVNEAVAAFNRSRYGNRSEIRALLQAARDKMVENGQRLGQLTDRARAVADKSTPALALLLILGALCEASGSALDPSLEGLRKAEKEIGDKGKNAVTEAQKTVQHHNKNMNKLRQMI